MKIIKYFKKKKRNLIKNSLNNKILGTYPKLDNSKIIFNGDNNILFCEENVILKDSRIEFNANNSIIYLSSSKHIYKLNVSVNNNCVFYIGKNNYINQVITAIVSEEKNIVIGNNGVFSLGIWFRTADPHLIYDIKTNKRINESKSIYIGDHIWIGQNALLLKGTQVDSGSILGANSVISNKIIHNNEIWAGNPIKFIKNDIFWDERCVHKWEKNDTIKSMNYNDIKNNKPIDIYKYKYTSKEYLSYKTIEDNLNNLPLDEKLNYLKGLSNKKNRFVRK
jgi:acetyltransferase-like isoleucine patch superfamily enzyme